MRYDVNVLAQLFILESFRSWVGLGGAVESYGMTRSMDLLWWQSVVKGLWRGARGR